MRIIIPSTSQQFPYTSILSFPSILLIIILHTLIKQISTNYIAATISPSSNIINTYTSYTLTIYRNQNPVTNTFISNIQSVPTSAYIQLDFPTDYQPISNITNPSCINTQTGSTLSCNINLVTNILTISNVFSVDSSMVNAAIIYILINNIKNPSTATQCGNFQYYIKYSNNSIIDQSPAASSGIYSTAITFLPGTFLSCSISANGNYIQTQSTLIFSLISANPIPTNGILIIDIPLYWDGDMLQSNTIVSSPICTSYSTSSTILSSTLSCSYNILPSPINIARITITSLSTSGIQSNVSYSISISTILTPPFTNNQQTIAIYSSWPDGTYIDTCTAKIINTVPITFLAANWKVINGSNKVQEKFNASLQLTLNRPFYYQDQIRLLLPNNYLVNNLVTITSSNYLIFTTTVQSQTNSSSTSSSSTWVVLSNFPSSPSLISSNNIFTLYFFNIYNYISTQPQSITITMYRYQQSYQSSTISVIATIGTFSNMNIISDSTIVNYIGNSTIQLSTQYNIPINSYIQILYNSAINSNDIIQTNIPYSALNGIKILNTYYNVSNNIITINNIFQTLFNISTSPSYIGLIQFTIPQFINPPTIKPLPYILTLYSSTSYPIASYTYTYISSLQSFNKISLQSSSYKVMQNMVTYSFTFTTYYSYKSVSILIPSQISIIDGYQSTCSPNTYTSCLLTYITNTNNNNNSNIVGYNNLTFIGTQVAGIHTLQYSNNINPNSYKPSSSFYLYTYIDGWGVQKSNGYLTLTMNQTNSFLALQTIPSSYKNYDLITVNISYTLNKNSPSGIITINIPNQIDISNAICNVNDNSSCQIIQPNILVQFNNGNNNVTHSFVVILSNVRNNPSYSPISLFTISLATNDGYASLYSTIASWTNNIPSVFSTNVTSDTGFRGENALFNFNSTLLTGKASYIVVQINQNFGPLTTAPLNSILINSYQVQYNITGQSQVSLSFTLQVPLFIANYTFTLLTYTSDGYLIGTSISNPWIQLCADSNNCRDCYSNGSCRNCYNSTLSQFYIYNTNDLTCIRACPSGYYLDTNNNNCILCNSNCLECINTSTLCTKCPTLPTIYYLNTIYNICTLKCDITYYPSSYTQTCLPCIGTCYSCIDQYKCLTCIPNYYLLNTSQQCISSCPINIMINNNLTRQCDYCDTNCLTCSLVTYNCTSCNNTQLLYLQNNKCVTKCLSQSYIQNNLCTPCKYPCKTCYNSTTTCSQCYPNSTLPLYYQYKCISLSQCTINHYINSVNGSCDICPLQCQVCISLTNCSSCSIGYYLYGNKCISTCNNITYKNDSSRLCQLCSKYGCATCEMANNCTTCNNNMYLYVGICYNICPNGLYPTYSNSSSSNSSSSNKLAICDICPINCITCINYTYCLTCIAQQYMYKGICYNNCVISTYPYNYNNVSVVQNLVCMDCPLVCRTCTSRTNCLTCSTNYSLENSQCVLTCSLGISYNQVCYPCGLNCALCQNTTCTLCAPNYYLQSNICVTQCSPDKLSLDNINCVACTKKYVNCTTCNNTQCLSCLDGQLTNGECLPCVPGTYTHNSKCVTCPSTCTICNNQTYCSACVSNTYLYNNYCVSVCPNNMIPNGTKCDICQPNCVSCSLVTMMCALCEGGMYMFEGVCYKQCPDPYVKNLNLTLCITKQAYSQQYSIASKPIYFPFSIAGIIILCIGIGLKCYINKMHIWTFLVATIAIIQLAAWIIFGIIQYMFYINLQSNAGKGIILILISLGMLILCNIVFVRFFCKYFLPDIQYIKWQKNHYCISKVFIIIPTIINFKIHRLIYSKLLDKDQLSLILSSHRKLIPISILSFISILSSSTLVIVASALAMYYSLNKDQQFFNAFDTLIITSLMVIFMVLDMRHPYNYFIDQLETQNMKKKIYHQDDQILVGNNQPNNKRLKNNNNINMNGDDLQKQSNISRQHLINHQGSSNILMEGQNIDNIMGTQKKLKNNQQGKPQLQKLQQNQNQNGQPTDIKNKTVKVGQNVYGRSQTAMTNKRRKISNKFQQSQQIQDSQNPILLKAQNPKQQKQYNQQQQFVLQQPQQLQNAPPSTLPLTNKLSTLSKKQSQSQAKLKSQPQQQPPSQLKSKPSTKPQWIQKQFDHHGYIIKYDKNNNIVRYDKYGNRVQIDQNGIHHYYNQQGHQVKQNPNKQGEFLRYDENGFIISKDGNLYDQRGYKVQKFKNDKQQQQFKFYDQNGYQVKKQIDQQGNQKQVKYNKDGFIVKINQQTKQHQFYTKQGYKVYYSKDQNGNQKILYKNQDNKYVRYNKQKNQWQAYDPTDNFILIKNQQTGQYIKYDEYGFRIQKDQYGNIYRYDIQGYRVLLGLNNTVRRFDKQGYEIKRDVLTGEIRKYDKDGYQMKIDQKTGQKILYDEHGFIVEKDFYGAVTRYDENGNLVIIDKQTGKIKKYNKQGLQIVDDGNGNIYYKDKRGRKLVQLQNGNYQKYDEQGNKIWLDEEGYQIERDQDGNIRKFDKVGDQIFQQQNQQGEKQEWKIDQNQGDNAMNVFERRTKPQKYKFKLNKQVNFEDQFSKLVQKQNKTNLLFNFEQQQQIQPTQNLQQFHNQYDERKPKQMQYQLQRQYQALYDIQNEKQTIQKQNNENQIKLNLSQLQQIDHLAHKKLKERGKKGLNGDNDKDSIIEASQIMIQPEEGQQKVQLKSMADASINQRSFDNQGVLPMTEQSRNNQDDLQSLQGNQGLDEMGGNMVNVKKNKNTMRSQSNFNKMNPKNKNNNQNNNEQIGATRSQINYNKTQKSSTKLKGKQKNRKIYDSDQQIQSYQQEQWNNDNPNIFYNEKDQRQRHTNANTNYNPNQGQIDGESDALSDFINKNNSGLHKNSQQHIRNNKYMQSIEQVEDQLFEKLKNEKSQQNNRDHKVKRTKFQLSGTPNPLVEYAKSIDIRKMQEQGERKKDRYSKDNKNYYRDRR